MARNAAALVDPPRVVTREIQPFDPEQARTLLTHCANHRLGALFTVAMALGLRLGEASGLRREDVDLNAGTLSVRQSLERSGGDAAERRRLSAERRELLKSRRASTDRRVRQQLDIALTEKRRQLKAVQAQLRFTEPKSARSRRTITLPDVVATALRAECERNLVGN